MIKNVLRLPQYDQITQPIVIFDALDVEAEARRRYARKLWLEMARYGLPRPVAGGSQNRRYSVNSAKTAAAAAGTLKVAWQLATGAAVTGTLWGVDISFDSIANPASAGGIPALVELVRETGASSGGAAQTPVIWKKGQIASGTTARINDTTDGAGPTVIMGWLVPIFSVWPQQLPLGREIDLEASDFLALRVTLQTGATACNYNCNGHFEE